MSDPEQVRRTFRARYADDVAHDRVRSLEYYCRVFAGYEDAIAEEYARLVSPSGAEPEAEDRPDGHATASEAAPLPPPSRAPDRVGPYEILRELGRGGQAAVYLAEDTRLSRRVALKVFSTGLVAAPEFVARFRREAEMASRLDHPGICTVFDAGVEQDTPYIAMRYVPGRTLRDRIDAAAETKDTSSAPVLDASTTSATGAVARGSAVMRVVQLIEKVARALHAAHQAGLIHRDVKPGNIVVDEDGEPVLLDFGLAREDDHGQTLTMTGTLLGTPAYMSPEQLVAQRIRLDCRTDVYSLGVTLYECLALRPPFEGPTRESLYQQILGSQAAPVRRRNPAVSRDLEVVLQTAMERDRDRRYQTALDMAEDLRRIRMHESIRARPTPALVRVGRWAQRHPAVATALGAIFAGLLLGLVTVSHFLERSQEEQARTVSALDAARAATDRAESESAARKRALEALALQERHARALALVALSSSAIETEPMKALLLAREAVRVERSELCTDQLRAAVFASRQRVVMWPPGPGLVAFAVAPRGNRIVTFASGDAVARVWDLDGRMLASLEGHEDAIESAVFSPDGQRIVTASKDGTARIWDPAGRVLAVLRAHTGAVLSARFSPRGDRIGTVSEDKTARVWDLDGREILTLAVPDRQIDRVEISPDGSLIATEMRGEDSLLWDATGRRIGEMKGFARGFTPDGQSILTVGPRDTWVALCDRTGKERFRIAVDPDGWPAIDCSPDGALLLVRARHTLSLYDIEGKPVAVLRGHTDEIRSAAFSNAGDRIVTASSDRTVRVWDRRGRPVALLQGGSRATWGARFDATGRRVVAADALDETIRVWDVVPAEAGALIGHEGTVRCVLFAPDGTRILTGGQDGTARVWDLDGKELAVLRGHEGPIRRMAASASGDLIATASEDRTARLWDWSGRPVAVLRGHEDPVRGVAFSPAGDRVSTTSGRWPTPKRGDNTARVWDLTGKQLAVLRGHETEVYEAWFSPQGDKLLTCSYDNTARLWDRTGKELAVVRCEASIDDVEFSPDGSRFVLARWPGVAEIHDLSGALVASLATPGSERRRLRRAHFTPDGKHVVTVGSDGFVRLLGVDGTTQREVRGPAGQIRAIAFTADGRFCATGFDDRSARISDLQGDEHAMLRGHAGAVRAAAFSPDGRLLVTASEDGTARLWRTRLDDMLALADERILRDWSRDERREYAELLGPENEVHLHAYEMIDGMAPRFAGVEELRAAVAADAAMAGDLRAAALRILAHRRDDGSALNGYAWPVVREPGHSAEACALALRQLELAVRLDPGSYSIKNSLGVAQYRVGNYADALATLTWCADFIASFPLENDGGVADVAAIAMCRQRLGETEAARAALEKARGLVRKARLVDEDSLALVREAEALIEPGGR